MIYSKYCLSLVCLLMRVARQNERWRNALYLYKCLHQCLGGPYELDGLFGKGGR